MPIIVPTQDEYIAAEVEGFRNSRTLLMPSNLWYAPGVVEATGIVICCYRPELLGHVHGLGRP